MKDTRFFIGTIPIQGDLILAPMDGISTHPFRLLTRRLGSAVTYTEFVSPNDVIHGRPHLEDHLFFTDEERPFGYQLLDNDPQRILRAALKLRVRNPDFFDINLGCPARFVCARGAGAGLLSTPQKIVEIVRLLKTNLDLPVTAKIRLGRDDSSRNHLDITRLLEDAGISMLAIHGRTQKQGYSGTADWDAIADAKQRVSIPVVANGDVRTVRDIERIRAHTGCDGVMIGRAALKNPWIFNRIDRDQVTPIEVIAMVKYHLQSMLDFYGSPQGLIFFRKHFLRYMDPYTLPREQALPMVTCEDPQLFIAMLERLDLGEPSLTVKETRK